MTGRPSLRLVRPEEELSDPVQAEAPAAGWVSDAGSLVALGVALEQLVGPSPDTDDGYTEEAAAWHARYRRAAEMVVEAANRDSRLLRSLISPPPDIGELYVPGKSLLLLAMIIIERKAGER
ncbi:MAG: hypothetical protein M3450_10110 [Actinomycetota bacterium]|nr:hypothetical protein [Actinomycetota bacterium]